MKHDETEPITESDSVLGIRYFECLSTDFQDDGFLLLIITLFMSLLWLVYMPAEIDALKKY